MGTVASMTMTFRRIWFRYGVAWLLLLGINTGCRDEATRGLLTTEAGYYKQSGNLSEFLTTEVKRYGGRTKVADPANIAALKADWRIKRDENGFQVLLDKKYEVDFKKLLVSAFGEPESRKEYPHLVYKVNNIGVSIVCDLGSERDIHLICLRGGAL